MEKIKDSTEMDLEILRLDSVQCPINGWQLITQCEKGSEWRTGCPLYKGKKELVDLKGEKFIVIHCEAEKLRRTNREKMKSSENEYLLKHPSKV